MKDLIIVCVLVSAFFLGIGTGLSQMLVPDGDREVGNRVKPIDERIVVRPEPNQRVEPYRPVERSFRPDSSRPGGYDRSYPKDRDNFKAK